jgi:hypothetical protein
VTAQGELMSALVRVAWVHGRRGRRLRDVFRLGRFRRASLASPEARRTFDVQEDSISTTTLSAPGSPPPILLLLPVMPLTFSLEVRPGGRGFVPDRKVTAIVISGPTAGFSRPRSVTLR